MPSSGGAPRLAALHHTDDPMVPGPLIRFNPACDTCRREQAHAAARRNLRWRSAFDDAVVSEAATKHVRRPPAPLQLLLAAQQWGPRALPSAQACAIHQVFEPPPSAFACGCPWETPPVARRICMDTTLDGATLESVGSSQLDRCGVATAHPRLYKSRVICLGGHCSV